ncbi:tetratricopeptide repeat protein, partial [Acinetobacter baumannii]|nr:tetratricopeptide repeat protein [Acinetobacter baumannii]
YANLSAVLQRLDRGDEALQVLQEGLQVRPSGILYTNLGNALFNRGDYIGAAKAFEHAVSSQKGNNIAYLRWANLADTLRWIPG